MANQGLTNTICKDVHEALGGMKGGKAWKHGNIWVKLGSDGCTYYITVNQRQKAEDKCFAFNTMGIKKRTILVPTFKGK